MYAAVNEQISKFKVTDAERQEVETHCIIRHSFFDTLQAESKALDHNHAVDRELRTIRREMREAHQAELSRKKVGPKERRKLIQRQAKELQSAVEKKRLEMDTKYDTKVEHFAILLGRREVYRKALQQLHTHKRQLEKFRKTVKVILREVFFFFS